MEVLLSSELPPLSSLSHTVRDNSDDICDILNAIGHSVESRSANLPESRAVTGVNWRAKLILAELRNWTSLRSKEDATIEFEQMLASL